MNKIGDFVAGVSQADIQRMPAWLDFLQSTTGLLLALFMWGHMAFVSSILISKNAMYTVTRFFEGEYFFGKPYPAIVSFIVALIFLIFIAHAGLAMRKFPSSYQQYQGLSAAPKAVKAQRYQPLAGTGHHRVCHVFSRYRTSIHHVDAFR